MHYNNGYSFNALYICDGHSMYVYTCTSGNVKDMSHDVFSGNCTLFTVPYGLPYNASGNCTLFTVPYGLPYNASGNVQEKLTFHSLENVT